MPAPDHCLALFRDQPGSFDTDIFLHEFAQYRWAYLAGFPEIIHTSVLASPLPTWTAVMRQVRHHSKFASDDLPSKWRVHFPGCEWNECDSAQVAWAYKRQLLRFDKACLLAKALEMTFAGKMGEHTLPFVDVYPHLRLYPAIFVVDGVDEWRFLLKYPNRITEVERLALCGLKRSLKPIQRKASAKPGEPSPRDAQAAKFNWSDDAGQFIAHAIKGNAMTWRNATLLRDAFNGLGGESTIRQLPRRTLRTLQRCNPFESGFVGLNVEQLDRIRTSFKLQKSA
jgi:hypothetical protein